MQTNDASNATCAVYAFAGSQGDQPLALHLPHEVQGPSAASLAGRLLVAGPEAALSFSAASDPERFRITLTVPPAPAGSDDDELAFAVVDHANGGEPLCRVVLRRTNCSISAALIERSRSDVPLRDASRAALLWHGWRRYEEIIGLKRFTSGKGGSDVLVFRPRLRDPAPDAAPEGVLSDVVSQAWGACLLVKTGPASKVSEEWSRFQTFLRDRTHPFMSRSEEYLTVHLAHAASDAAATAVSVNPTSTIIGSFLGGDLLRAEPFEQLVQGATRLDRCIAVIDRLFSVLDAWHAGGAVRPLSDWKKKIRFGADGRLLLSGKIDLSDRVQREQFAEPLAWDVPFIKEAHLRHHLLGREGQRDGLLYRLLDLEVRYSLIHGDLHSRNILADENDIWLIDFGETGVGPTLFDYAKLEVYLRYWCLRLNPQVRDVEGAAFRFESLLLDHLTGSEASLEPVCHLAESLGADPDELLRAAHCICAIRRHAMRHMLGTPDRRDYLAVLYLTVFDTLRWAGNAPELAENYRLLVSLAWVVEDVLSRIVGLAPYPRHRESLDPRRLITRPWLEAPSLPGRVVYLMNSPNDREALAPLAAARGVMQNDHHHLDVFDHTLLVLGYVERLLDNPLEGLLDPDSLDQQVQSDLASQGICLPRFAHPNTRGGAVQAPELEPHLDAIRGVFQSTLDEDSRLVLKAAALFHDAGKAAARSLTNNAGKRQVQFLGHEVYGLQLVSDHLNALFEDRPAMRQRVARLIRYHHDHHNLVNRYSGSSAAVKDLEKMLATQTPLAKEWTFLADFMDCEASKFCGVEGAPHVHDFPLLILHGFADRLACRGPATVGGMAETARIDLLLLALFAAAPDLRERQEIEQESDRMTRGLDRVTSCQGKALGDVIKDSKSWFIAERMRRRSNGQDGPSQEEVHAKAIEFARQRGCGGSA